jgi:FdrA protein
LARFFSLARLQAAPACVQGHPLALGKHLLLNKAAKQQSWTQNMYPDEDRNRVEPNALLAAPPRVINVGLELFAENLASQGAQVVHVQWTPPAGGNARLAGLLAKLQS